MRVDEEEADVLLGEIAIDARRVPALGQPDAARIAAEVHAVVRGGHPDLRAHRFRMHHERQEAVRRAAGDDLQDAVVLQPLEGSDEVALVPIVKQPPQVVEVLAVVPGERPELGIVPQPVHFLVGQLAERIETLRVPREEQLVAQHANERRRQGHRDAERDPFVDAPVEDLEQRQVRLGDRLVEPVLLEELGIFRVAHVRQVRVEHDGEDAAGHGSSSLFFCTVPLHGTTPPVRLVVE